MHVDDLTYAAEANEAATIERAIETGFALDTLDRFGRTALLVAAHNGRLAIVQQLIAAGASPTAHATDAEVKYRLGAKPRTELVGRWTLLHSAALGGDIETIAWLIDTLGLGVDDRDHGGWTPLHVAAYYPLSTVATLDALLARSADPDAPDAVGRNPLCKARDDAFARRLVLAGADVSGGDLIWDPQLALQMQRPIDRFAMAGEVATVEFLIERGAQVTTSTFVAWAGDGDPALLADLLAVQPGDAVIGPALASPRTDAAFALLLAAMREVPATTLILVAGQPVRMQAVLARGVPVDVHDEHGRTALHRAAELGSLESVRLLLERGADANARDADGKSPRALAWRKQETAELEEIRRILEPLTHVAPEPAAVASPLAPGTRVRHVAFGTGVVVGRNGDKATVRFDSVGEKTLLARVLAPAT